MTSLISTITDETPIGRMMITSSERHIISVKLFAHYDASTERLIAPSPHVQELIEQFSLYFQQAHHDWSVPLAIQGTAFQQKVWQHLQAIPLGETRTYSDIASELNTSARAVGNACRTNPFAIVIPCHRVVSKSGLGGYYGKTMGEKMDVKQWLLEHER